MVDETGFPRGKGSRNCPTFCSFSQPRTSPSWPVPAQKGLAGPREPWGHAPALAFAVQAGMLKVSQAGLGPALAAWEAFSEIPRAWGRTARQCRHVSPSVNYLGKRGGDLFKMHMHSSRMKPGNLNCC